MKFEVASQWDPSAWDQFVATHPSGHFMQSHAWGNFQRELGWEPIHSALQQGGTTRAAALILGRSVPGLGAKVFYTPRGPVVDPSDVDSTEALVRHLADFVKQRRGVFLRCDPYWTDTDAFGRLAALARRVPRDWSYWNGPRFVLWLDLRGDENTVMSQMSSRSRNDTRRGYRNGVVFTLGTDADLADFHRLMALTGNRKDIAFHDLDYYRRLLSVVSASAKVQLFIGRFEGEVITAGVSVAYGKKAWLLYAASSPKHYKLRANRAQQWEMIKWAHSLGCERYDFRGTATNDPPSPKDPGFGVYEFKKSFGPEFIRLAGYYDVVQRPLMYRLFRIAEERGLPLAYRCKTWLQERQHGGPQDVPAETGNEEK